MNLWELSVHKVCSVKKNLLYSQYKFDFDLCKLINLGYETTKSHVVADWSWEQKSDSLTRRIWLFWAK